MKALEKKADLVIDSEKKFKKDFNQFSVLKKLKIVDSKRQKGLKNRQDKNLNNIKW